MNSTYSKFRIQSLDLELFENLNDYDKILFVILTQFISQRKT